MQKTSAAIYVVLRELRVPIATLTSNPSGNRIPTGNSYMYEYFFELGVHPHIFNEKYPISGIGKTKKIYFKYEKNMKKYGIFVHPGKELTTPCVVVSKQSLHAQ